MCLSLQTGEIERVTSRKEQQYIREHGIRLRQLAVPYTRRKYSLPPSLTKLVLLS